jgi:hypothetical protein
LPQTISNRQRANRAPTEGFARSTPFLPRHGAIPALSAIAKQGEIFPFNLP